MINNGENIIKNVFKTIENKEIGNPTSDWMLLSKKLKWQNFMKFSIYHLNIYYAAAAAFTGGVGTYATVNYIQQQKNNSNISKEIIVTDSISAVALDTVAFPVELIEKPQEVKKTKAPILPVQTNKNNQVIKDTVTLTVSAQQNENEIIKKPIIKKKTVYLSKRDTIFTYDTVKIKR